MLCRQSNNPAGVLQATKPIRRYIMGSNHSFIGGLGENYAALGENWHINFQSLSLKKQKEKPTNGIKPLVDWTFLAQREGFEPSWDCSQTDFESAPLWPLRYRCVYFSQHQPSKSTPEKGENWWRELQNFFPWWYLQSLEKSRVFRKTVPKWSLVFESGSLWPLRYVSIV